MTRSRILASLSPVLLATACNLSSTVGSNDGAGGSAGGGTVSTTAAGEGGSSSSTASSSGGATTSTDAATTSSTTSTGSGGSSQGAYVTVRTMTSLGWIQETTIVEVRARPTPISEDFPVEAPAPCTLEQVPDMASPPPPDDLDLSGVHVTVTADGYASVDAIWAPVEGVLAAQFPSALPSGTPVHVSFDAASPLLAGQTIDVTSQSMTFVTPPPQSVLTYPSGTDFVFDWTSAAMPNVLYAFAANTVAPPATITREHCAAPAAQSTFTIPKADMAGLIGDLEVQRMTDPGAQIWVNVVSFDVQGQDEAIGGCHVTRGAWADFSRPVDAGN